jgi:type IV secretory pathway TrbD component
MVRPMTTAMPVIKVNRAPVLTLWAAVVAERLGHPPDTALSLASAVAGTAARAKARPLGISEQKDHAKERADAAPARVQPTTQLLGRQITLTHDKDGVVLAEGGGEAAPAGPVQVYVAKAFGDHLAEVRKAMEDLAARYDPEELNRVGFRLYEEFRPEVPPDMRGRGAKGVLDAKKIRSAGGPSG